MLRHAPKLSLALAAALAPLAPAQTIRVHLPTHITLPGVNPSPLIDGRLLVLLSTDPTDEPRMQINDTPNSQLVFGMTLDGAQPGSTVTLSPDAQGYPIASLAAVPPGDYTLQVVLNLYETFHRADGKTIKLAPDRGEGQHWNLAPGNPLSTPQKIHLAAAAAPIDVALDHTIPPIPPLADTPYIRRLRIQSPLLTKFWGTPVYLSATVLVPAGFDQHPQARFPLMVFEDHFNDDFAEFRPTPPDPTSSPITPSASTSLATTASSSRKPTTSTSSGPPKTSPASSSSRSSTPIPITTTPTPSTRPTSAPTARPSRPNSSPLSRPGSTPSAPAGPASSTAARPVAGSLSPPSSSTPTTTTALSSPALTR